MMYYVQFKDEYKQCNAELEKSNEQLRCENEQLFSAAINERDSRIAELEKSESSLKRQLSSLHAQCRSGFLIFSLFLNFINYCTCQQIIKFANDTYLIILEFQLQHQRV